MREVGGLPWSNSEAAGNGGNQGGPCLLGGAAPGPPRWLSPGRRSGGSPPLFEIGPACCWHGVQGYQLGRDGQRLRGH
jgi:hypothetical protein